MPLKRCFRCGLEKPLDQFYKHFMMADGHLGKCKSCTKADSTARRRGQLEAVRAYDRERSTEPSRIAKTTRVTKAWREKHPDRWKAQIAVNNAVRDRRLFKPETCEIPGCDGKPQAHHDDYDKPLTVRWLCKPHHWEADEARRRGESE